MIFDDLDKSIDNMNAIKELEQSSDDLQRQERIENIFKGCISETIKMVNAIQKGYAEFSFKISLEQKQNLLKLIKEYERCMNTQKIREDRVVYLQKECNSVKKEIAREWDKWYTNFSSPVINMLQNVKKIVENQDKVTFAINKIKEGKNWDFKIEVLDRMKKGRMEADDIIRNLGLIKEVSIFLEKVSSGNATLSDLNDKVIRWLVEKKMTERLSISFK